MIYRTDPYDTACLTSGSDMALFPFLPLFPAAGTPGIGTVAALGEKIAAAGIIAYRDS